MLHSNGGMVAAVGRLGRLAAALVAAGVCAAECAPALAAAESAQQPAAWVQKELNFRYVGFTTRYSCDGLKDRMLRLLLRLGARDDLKVITYGCISPQTTPGVRIVMHVLQPASAPAGQAVAAHWQTVDVLADRDLFDAARDCELIAQLDREVLPLFSPRHVDYSVACHVNDPLTGGTRLKADVLVSDAARPVTAAR